MFHLEPAAHLDFEGTSATDLRQAGVYRYAEDPSTRVWGFRWRIGQTGRVHEFRPGNPHDPTELLEHIQGGGKVIAHNSGFERIIWNVVLRRNNGLHYWPIILASQQSCTMARALFSGFPGKLEDVAAVLGTTNQKDRDGHALMMKMAKPRKINPDGTITWWDEPLNIDRLMQYCGIDVETETDVDDKLPDLTASEQAVWEFDQLINDRGVPIDLTFVRRAVELVELAKKVADRHMRALTSGHVEKCSEVQKLVKWLQSRGILCEAVRKGTFDELVFMTEVIGDEKATKAIELRRASAKTSTAKFAKMLKCVCADGRMRGLLAYWGARTGRWAGRLVQPQNFPRFDHEKEDEVAAVMFLIDLLAYDAFTVQDVHDAVELVHFDVLPWLAKSLRSAIMAPPGNKLVGGDYSNIEGRVNAWLARQHWKLDAFRAYDNKTGPDLYKVAYSGAFNVEIESVTKLQRQIGKVIELALGYQGSVNAFLTMAPNYGLDPFTVAKAVIASTDPDKWDLVARGYEHAVDKAGLQLREWTALKIVVNGFRASNADIVQSWWDYQDAALQAVENPGVAVWVRNGEIPVAYLFDGNCLYCQLPSGRVLTYVQAHVRIVVKEIVNDDGDVYETKRKTVFFWGQSSKTKQWSLMAFYGGLQCENVTQAVARDIMVYGMMNVERAGYPVILTVHDETLSEVAETFGSASHYASILAMKPDWTTYRQLELPLSASAFEDRRYVH